MAPRRTNPDFLNGVPELLILKLLADDALHGYEIVRKIRLLTNARLEFGEGCIYPILHRLEAEGLLRCRTQEVRGRKRMVYRATARGRKRLQQAASEWERVVTAVRSVLEGATDVCRLQMA